MRAFGLALLITLALAPHAFAQQAPAPAGGTAIDPEALDIVRRGVALREAGHDAAALVLFREALARAPVGRVLAQTGLAEQALGSWLDAEAHLRAALASTEDAGWIARHRAELEGALAVIAEHVGVLVLRCDDEGLALFVDERSVGATPVAALEVRTLVGDHLVSLHRGADTVAVQNVTVAGGARVELTLVAPQTPSVELHAEPRAPSDAPAQAEASPLLFVGAGITALGLGFVLGIDVSAQSLGGAWEQRRVSGTCVGTCDADYAGVLSSLDAHGLGVNLAWAGVALGGALALTGVLLTALLPPRTHPALARLVSGGLVW